MLPTFRLFLAFAIICALAITPSGQDEPRQGWKAAKYRKLYLEVPRGFQVTKGTGPGYIGQTPFELNYISAGDLSNGLFASSGYGSVPRPYGASRSDIKELEEQFLEKFFAPLDLPGIGRFVCDSSQADISKYKALEASVRETMAQSVASGKEYRIYFVLSFKASGSQIRISYVVAGCPEDKIEDNNRVMSAILASVNLSSE